MVRVAVLTSGGFIHEAGTALDTALDAIDCLRATAASHECAFTAVGVELAISCG